MGRFAVFGALALFVASAVFALAGRERWAARSFVLGGLSLFVAFGSLAALFVTDQFQFRYVFDHADRSTPLQYKIAGIWSGQEGSFLLWASMSAAIGALAARHTAPYRRWFTASYAVFLAALAGILAYESPFRLIPMSGSVRIPPDGMGMQPSLLNYWVTIHPPTIFLGFASLTVLFCWAVAAILKKDLDSWIPQVRPWAIFTVTVLGVGLCMGGFWAYETLGWGGFWAWDPVENVSLVPWCFGVAFLHGIFIQLARNKWHRTNLLLAGLPFLWFVYGTFMTRSGFVSEASVHSFAQMDRSALRILVGLLGVAVLSFAILWIRSFKIDVPARSEPVEPLTREAGFSAGIVALCGLGLVAGIGMSVPLFMALAGRSTKVVEEALYHQVVPWFFVPIALLMAIVPFLGWRGLGLRKLWIRISNVVAVTFGLLGFSLIWIKSPSYGPNPDFQARLPFLGSQVPLVPWMVFLIGISLFAIIANLWRMMEFLRRSPMSLGGFLSHLGVMTLVLGLIISRGFERSERTGVQAGSSSPAMGYLLTYRDFTKSLLDRDNKILFDVTGPEGSFTASPGLYFKLRQEGEPQPVSWPWIKREPSHDLYLAIGAPVFDATEPTRFKQGESKLLGDIAVSYEKMTREGEPGQQGTKFIANLVVKLRNGQEVRATPSLEIGGERGLIVNTVPVGEDYAISLNRMDAADSSVELQLQFQKPVFPVELFYKPMTILVWLGTGIMLIGGFLSTAYRKRSQRTVENYPEEIREPLTSESETTQQEHAASTVA
jgi:cytochrome c-type biogenesis protein CcmF